MSRASDDRPPSRHETVDDAEQLLLRRVAAGDVDAFAALVARHYAPLVRFATRLVGAHDAAEDVLQDVWLRVWRARGTISADEPIRAYLFTAVRRACANERRARTREASALGRMAAAGAPDLDPPPDVLGRLADDEVAAALHRAVDGLPARCREVWLLAREQGLSYAEIAAVLGISVNTVKTQMARGMAVLRGIAAGYLALAISLAIRG